MAVTAVTARETAATVIAEAAVDAQWTSPDLARLYSGLWYHASLCVLFAIFLTYHPLSFSFQVPSHLLLFVTLSPSLHLHKMLLLLPQQVRSQLCSHRPCFLICCLIPALKYDWRL